MSIFLQANVAFTGGAAALYGDAPGDRRAREIFVQTVVTLDGPLPLDALAQRFTEAAGLGRTGARIRETVERTANALVSRGQITRDAAGFLWPVGMTSAPPRVPASGERPRPIEHVCREEIGELIVALLKVAFGMRRDELVTETARHLGYNRTGTNVRERIEAALNQLELDSRAHIMGGQVHTLELDPA